LVSIRPVGEGVVDIDASHARKRSAPDRRQLELPAVLPHPKMLPILNRLPQLNLTGA
jgi:hypothetical protein